jgi:hypothetical protein
MKTQKVIYKIASVFALAAILLSAIPYSVNASLQPGTGDPADCLGHYPDVNGNEVCTDYTKYEYSLGNRGLASVRDAGRERPFIYFARDFL